MSKRQILYLLFIAIAFSIAMVLSGILFGFYFPLICHLFTWGFAAATTLMHLWLVRSHESDSTMFVSYFMGTVLVKMMITFIPLFLYLHFFPEHKAPVSLSFLITYFVFTGIETYLIYKKIRHKPV